MEEEKEDEEEEEAEGRAAGRLFFEVNYLSLSGLTGARSPPPSVVIMMMFPNKERVQRDLVLPSGETK